MLGSLTFDVTTVRFLYVFVNASNTVDGRNPAPPGMYKTYSNLGNNGINCLSTRISSSNSMFP